ncbi:hypothetical protein [Actinoallomurus sp. NPDC050550]|uniref:hypothetical protein n=1 Tax=Actinoallomurus sp. NPDC050550 TaxID=3154937 RepID=UPI003408A789
MVWGQAYGEGPSAAAQDPFAVVERDTRAMVTAGWWATTPPLQRQNLTAGRMLVLPDGTWWLFGAWARWYRWLPADGQWHLCPPPRLPMTRTSARPLAQGMAVPRIPPHLVPSGPDFSQEPPQALPFVDVDVRPEVTSRVRATLESAAALPPHDYPHWWGAFSSSTPSTVAVGWGVMLWSAAAPVFYSGLDAQLLDIWSPYRARPLPDVDGPRWLTPPPLESLVGLYAERLRAHRVDAAVVILRTMWAMASALRQDARFRPRADALLAVLGSTLHNPTVDYAALPYGDQAIVQQWLTRCPPVLAPALRIEASAGEHFRNAFYDLALTLASVAGDPAEQGYVEPRLIAAALLAADLAVVRRDVAAQVIGWLDPETRRTTQAILTGPDHPLRRFWPQDNRLPPLLRRRVEKLRPSARGALLATMYALDLAWCRLGGGIPARPRGFPVPVAILSETLGPDRARSAAPADPVTPTPGLAPLARQYPARPAPAAPPAAPPVAHQPPTGPPGQAPTWAPPPAAAAGPAGTMADVGPPQVVSPAAAESAGTVADVGPPPVARPAASAARDAAPPGARSDVSSGTADPQSGTAGSAGTMADVGPPQVVPPAAAGSAESMADVGPVARSAAAEGGTTDVAASSVRPGEASGDADADSQSAAAGPPGTMADVGPPQAAQPAASAGGTTDAAATSARPDDASGQADAGPPSAGRVWGASEESGPASGESGLGSAPPATQAWDPSGEPGSASATRVAWEPERVGEATMLDRPSGPAGPPDATYIDAPSGGTRADAGGVPMVGPPPAYSGPPVPPGLPTPFVPPTSAGGPVPPAPPSRTRVPGEQGRSAEPPGTRIMGQQPERPGTRIMSQTMMGDLLGAPMPGRPVGDIEPPPSGTVLPEVTERFGIRFVSGEDALAGLLDGVRRRASSGGETSPALLVVGAPHGGQRRLARLVARTLADAGVGDGSVRTVDGTDAHGDPVRVFDASPVGGTPLLFEWIDAALSRASDPAASASSVTRSRENGAALIATCQPGAYKRLRADFPELIGIFRVFRLPDLSDTETRLALVHVLSDERRVTVNAPALQTVKADLPRLKGYGDLVNARLVEAYLDRAIARHTDRFGAASRDRLVLMPEDFSGVAEEIEPALRAPGDVDGFLRSLDEMIGLDEVKQTVGDLVTEARLAAERAAQGLPSGNPSRHLVFLGRPGTGKRTVAGLIGGMYAALNILDSGQVVVCSARDFAGADAAAKVAAQVDRAVGGVLLIEDASLLDRTSVAVTALLQNMEERRDKFLVICSSEPDEMDGFLLANPGFRAEFGAIVEFREPTDRQLVKLFSRFAERELYLLDEELRVELLGRFGEMRGSRGFAFAETVRRLFDAIVARQAARLAGARVDAATVARLTVRDLPESPAERLLQHLHEDRTRR